MSTCAIAWLPSKLKSTLPVGKPHTHRVQGHQCWIGRTERAITSTGNREWNREELIEGRAAPHAGHIGVRTPGGVRADLSREIDEPQFYHFATDIAGRRFITDSGPRDGGGGLWTADVPEREGDPLRNWTFLLNPQCSWDKSVHIHPFLSPDGNTGFFNSDESGILQACMVRGF